jgi:hypothetical protein
MEAIKYYLVLKTDPNGTRLSRDDEILRCSIFVQTFWSATGGGWAAAPGDVARSDRYEGSFPVSDLNCPRAS